MVTEKCARYSDTAANHKYNCINPFIWHLNNFAKQFFALRPSASNLQQRILPSTEMWDSMLYNCLQGYKLPHELIPAVICAPQPTLQLPAAAPAPAPQDIHHQDTQRTQDTETGQQLQKKLKSEGQQHKFVQTLPTPIKTVVNKLHNLPCYNIHKFTINKLRLANGIDTDKELLAKLGLPPNSCIISALKGVCTRPSCLRDRIHTPDLPPGFDTAGTVRLLKKTPSQQTR